jgi:hypothetical protein
MSIPYTFQNATGPLPLNELDTNFSSLDTSVGTKLAKDFSSLTSATSIGSSDLLAIYQGSTSKNISPSTLTSYVGSYFNLKSFGVIGDGVTDDTTAFTAACTYAVANKVALYGDSSLTVRLTSTVNVAGGLVLVGEFKIIQGTSGGIKIEPPRTVSTTVTATGTVQYPASTGLTNSYLTVTSATGLSKGDVCQIRSADTYSFNAWSRLKMLSAQRYTYPLCCITHTQLLLF